MTPAEKQIRTDTLNEIIMGYDQMIGIFESGGAAAMTGHAYDPKENLQKIELLKSLKESVIAMRDQ
jgi:hypothetical protein